MTLREELKIKELDLVVTGSGDNEISSDTYNEWSSSYADKEYINDPGIFEPLGSILYVLTELHDDFVNVQQTVSQSVYTENVVSVVQINSGSRINEINTITAADTTPSVEGITVYKTDNGSQRSDITITAFDDAKEGQSLTVLITDDKTVFENDARDRTTNGLKLSGNQDWSTSAANDSITFIYNGTRWIETNRSDNS